MKTTIRYIMRAAALSCLLAAAATAYGGEIRYTLRLDPSAIETDTINAPDGTPYLRLWAPDCDYVGEPGEPMIPYRCINFLVPTYSNNFTVTVDNVTTAENRTLGLPLYPVQEPQLSREYDPDKFTLLSSEDGNNDGVPCCGVSNEYFVNGSSHIVRVAVPLSVYKKATSSLGDVLSIDFTLNYSECNVSEMNLKPSFAPASIYDTDLEQLVVNPPVTIPVTIKASNTKAVSFLEQKKYYCIITPEEFKESLADYISWKRQKGHTVIVKTVEEILADPQYEVFDNGNLRNEAFDKEAKIKNWILSEHENLGAFQLLLIGDDTTSAPIRKLMEMSVNNSKPSSEWYDGQNFFATDTYFSDINSEYKLSLQSNGYYSEIYSQFSFNPTLPTGRLLVNKPKEIKTYFDKLLTYQLDPGLGDASYLDSGLLIQQYDNYLHSQADNAKSIIEQIDLSNKIMYKDRNGINQFEQNFPTGKTVIDAMKQCGIISLQGHGSPCSIEVAGGHNPWYEARYIKPLRSSPMKEWNSSYKLEDGNSYEDLDNAGKPSVIYSEACTAVPFGRIRDDKGYKNIDYNISTAYLFAGDFGGVAFVGTSRDCYIDDNLAVENQFGSRLNENTNLAAAILASKNQKLYKLSLFARNLIGDPDIDVWTHSPVEMSIDMQTDFKDITLSGNDLRGMSIVFYNGDNKSVNVSVTGSSSKLSFSRDELGMTDDNDYSVSVYGKNSYPHVRLFASGSRIKDKTKSYFLREENIVSDIDKPCFTVMQGGTVHLTATRNLTTDKAFEIEDGGTVNLRSFRKVLIGQDKVKDGGVLEIEGHEVELSSGFSVEKGGVLVISTEK